MLKPKFFKLNIQLLLWSLRLWAGVPRFTLVLKKNINRLSNSAICWRQLGSRSTAMEML